MTEKTFDQWVILEILGHRQSGGHLTVEEIAGTGFLRLDIPGDDGQEPTTQYYAPASIYAIHPTTEEIARHFARTHRAEPVYHWQLPAAPPLTPTSDVDIVDDPEAFGEGGGPF